MIHLLLLLFRSSPWGIVIMLCARGYQDAEGCREELVGSGKDDSYGERIGGRRFMTSA